MNVKKILRSSGNALSLVFRLFAFSAFALSLVFLVALIIVRLKQTTGFDDAYMYIRYAKNFWAGYGIAWNRDGIQTYGTTSLLYLALIILFQGVFSFADGSSILILTSASLSILGVTVTAFACARLTKSKIINESFPLVLAIITTTLVFSKIFLFHTASGMDASLSFLCNAILIFVTLGWITQKNKFTLFHVLIASYLSFLARPDNLIYAVTFPFLCILLLDESAERKNKIIRFLAGVGAFLLIDATLKVIVFGDPLPLPFYAKTNGFYEGYLSPQKWSPVIQLFAFGKLTLPFIVLIIATATSKMIKTLIAFLFPVLITFLYYFNILQVMGHEARYYFPALPFFIISSVLVLDNYISKTDKKKISVLSVYLRLIIIFLFSIFILTSAMQTATEAAYEKYFIPAPHVYVSSVKYAFAADKPLPILGWLESIHAISALTQKLPSGTKFAMSEYGFVGANSAQIYIIDPLGLHDPFFAHHGFSSSNFFSRNPDLIWFPHSDYSKIIASIQGAPEFWRDYDYYPNAFDYGLAVRKNNEIIDAKVKEAWRHVYPNLDMKSYLAQATKP